MERSGLKKEFKTLNKNAKWPSNCRSTPLQDIKPYQEATTLLC